MSGVCDPQHDERTVADWSNTGKRKVVKRLRLEQTSYFLLRKLLSCFGQPGDFILDLYVGTFSAAVPFFIVPRHRVFVGCKRDTMRVAPAKGVGRR